MAFARLLDRTGRFTGDLNAAQLRLLAYLSRHDEELSERRRVESFQDTLLIHNPKLYSEIYDEEGRPKVPDEQIDYQVPNSEADVESMMADLKRYGLTPP